MKVIKRNGEVQNFDLLEPKFTPTDITPTPSPSRPATKTLRHGKILIHHNSKTYNTQGIQVK